MALTDDASLKERLAKWLLNAHIDDIVRPRLTLIPASLILHRGAASWRRQTPRRAPLD